MWWISLFGVVAVVVAAAAFVAAEWFREPGVPASDCPGFIAMVAGLLWPVLLIGLLQWSGVALLRSGIRSEPQRVSPSRHPVG